MARSSISLTPDVKDHAAAILQLIQLCEAHDGIATFTLNDAKRGEEFGSRFLRILTYVHQSWCGCNGDTVAPTYCDMIGGGEISNFMGIPWDTYFSKAMRQWIEPSADEFNNKHKGIKPNQIASKIGSPLKIPWLIIYGHYPMVP